MTIILKYPNLCRAVDDPVLVFKLNSLPGGCKQSSWTSQLVLLEHHHEDGDEHDEHDEHDGLVLLVHLISALLFAAVRVDHSRLKQNFCVHLQSNHVCHFLLSLCL